VGASIRKFVRRTPSIKERIISIFPIYIPDEPVVVSQKDKRNIK